jgi:hypothetical protein
MRHGANNPLLITQLTINVMHDATAPKAGDTAFMVAFSAPIGYSNFWSANASTADSIFQVDEATGDGFGLVRYDADPATNQGAVQVYCDEDAAATAGRLQHADATFDFDFCVPLYDGRLVCIVYNANAAVDGVAVYFDDNAGDPTEALYFISPTTANTTHLTSADRSFLAGV